jgi:hypothetical protein
LVDRWSHRPASLPYNVLAHFTSVTGLQESALQAPVRTARVLAEGVGAASVQVWLVPVAG